MNKKILLMIIAIIMFVISIALRNYKPSELIPENTSKTEEVKESEEEHVILLSHYINCAWGIDNHGYYITSKGNKYTFKYNKIVSVEDIFNDKNNKIECKLSKKELVELKELLDKITVEPEFEKKDMGCDIGETSIYKVIEKDNMYETILLGANGVTLKKPSDKNVLKIFKIIDFNMYKY